MLKLICLLPFEPFTPHWQVKSRAARKAQEWKYVEVENPVVPGRREPGVCQFRCTFCSKSILGGLKRLRHHLGGVPGADVSGCKLAPPHVKDSVRKALAKSISSPRVHPKVSLSHRLTVMFPSYQAFYRPSVMNQAKCCR